MLKSRSDKQSGRRLPCSTAGVAPGLPFTVDWCVMMIDPDLLNWLRVAIASIAVTYAVVRMMEL